MFTGIITGIGHIQHITPLGKETQHGLRLHIQAPAHYVNDVQLGDSIALNGACMTVTDINTETHQFSIEISAHSLQHTIHLDTVGTALNLEKALHASDRLGGHIVSGHVDGIGTVHKLTPQGESYLLRIALPKEFAPFMAYKGSIAINGVSLTINAVEDALDTCIVSINLIAHTMQNTTLQDVQAQDQVNIEIDPIARYVQRMLHVQQNP